MKKIKSLQEIESILEFDRKNGLKIVHCHGVFDLLHPGHIRHFKLAKNQGDKLIVSITPDRYVNKGPGRPAFTESLRLESIASLQEVDYVVLNDSPDSVSLIKKIKPTIYVKGSEYSNHSSDVTGKITDEVAAVQSIGGEIFYTNDIVFSSSSLLNRYFDETTPEIEQFMSKLKNQYTLTDLLETIHSLKDLKVLVIGDAIIDEYQYVEPLGQSGKGLHMVARCQDNELFLGGSLIIANHVAQFTENVTLITAVGKNCSHLNFIRSHLDPNIDTQFVYSDTTTLTKKRYVYKDGKSLSKLFETYSALEDLDTNQTQEVVNYLKDVHSDYDLVLVCDFGNGFTNHLIIDAISNLQTFLALNTQTNGGNRGYNVVTNYRHANYIALNESELRLSAHDRKSSLEGIIVDIGQVMGCQNISITRGVQGVLCCSPQGLISIPAFITNSIDRIGAGDSYLSLSSLFLAKQYPMLLAGFIGSLAAAMSVQIVGNREAINKVSLCKFLTRLMK